MAFQDKTLVCRDCGSEFTFTAGEQEFYAQKGFDREPTRCPECRAKKKSQMRGNFGGPKQMYPATCGNCGKACEVPFQPRGDKPVYCADCFRSMRGQNRPA